MQLSLSFAQDPSSQIERAPDVGPLLSSEQRSEAISVLAKLLAKAAAPDPTVDPNPPEEEMRND